MRVRFEMVLELLIEYGEHKSSSDAHLPNVIRTSCIHFVFCQLILVTTVSFKNCNHDVIAATVNIGQPHLSKIKLSMIRFQDSASSVAILSLADLLYKRFLLSF